MRWAAITCAGIDVAWATAMRSTSRLPLVFGALVLGSVAFATPSAAQQSDASTFDRDAASTALSSVDLGKCKTSKAKLGEGHVMVTFTPKGVAAEAVIDRGPMVGTAAQKCIEKIFKKAKVPAFTGDAVRVGKTFRFE